MPPDVDPLTTQSIRPFNRTSSSGNSDVEAEMKARVARMRRVCDEKGLRLNESVKSWEWMAAQEEKLVWCNVFKSGSSSWLFIFNQLAGLSPIRWPKEAKLLN